MNRYLPPLNPQTLAALGAQQGQPMTMQQILAGAGLQAPPPGAVPPPPMPPPPMAAPTPFNPAVALSMPQPAPKLTPMPSNIDGVPVQAAPDVAGRNGQRPRALPSSVSVDGVQIPVQARQAQPSAESAPQAAGFAGDRGAGGEGPLSLPDFGHTGGHPTAAQSVSLVSPETRAGIEGAEGEQRAAAQDAGAAAQGQNAAEGDAALNASLAAATQQDLMRSAEKKRQEAYAAQQADYDKLRNEAAQGKIDPQQWEKSRNGGQKFTDIVSVILGGLAMGRNGAQSNVGLDLINRKIDQNIAAQRDNLDNKHRAAAAAGNSLRDMRDRFGDERTAEAAERAKQLEQFKATAQVEMARASSPAIAAKLKEQIAAIDMEQAKMHGQLEKWVPAGTTGGGLTEAQLAKEAMELVRGKVYPTPEAAREAVLRTHGVVSGGTSPGFYTAPGKGGAAAPLPGHLTSTAWDPSRYFQGTEAGKHARENDRYNAAVLAFGHSQGIRDPEKAREAYRGYIVEPGDTQATANEKLRAFAKLRSSAPEQSLPDEDADAGITPAGR